MFSRLRTWQSKRDASVLDVAQLREIYPSQEDLNDDPDFNRHLAGHHAADHRGAMDHSRQAAIDLSKWLLTSLMALNSGGAIAVTQIEFRGNFGVAAGAVFLIGIILSLLSAQIGIRTWLKLNFPMGKQLGYWQAVQHNGYRDREMELEVLGLGSEALN